MGWFPSLYTKMRLNRFGLVTTVLALQEYTHETAHDIITHDLSKHVIHFHKDELPIVDEPEGCLHLGLQLHRKNQRILEFFDVSLPANESVALVDQRSDLTILMVYNATPSLIEEFCST